VRGAGADERVCLRDGVAEAGAGGVRVIGGGRVRPDAVGDDRRDRRRLLHVADGRDDHEVDELWRDTGLLDRLGRRIRCEVDREDADGRPRACDDAGALLDPLVARVDRSDELRVRNHEIAAGGAVAVDAGELAPADCFSVGVVMRRSHR
jgi:hypothetical protein